MALKLPYGLKDGVLTHIDEVLESGLKCGCKCPACDAQLIARKGAKKIHHFAHYNAPECTHAVQTALHLAAKEIIAREKKFRIPEFVKFPNNEEIFTEDEQVMIHIPFSVSLVPEKTYDVQNVFLEKCFSDFVPDIILEIGNQKLFVEIAVTHFVDQEKLEKIKREGVSVIEVNLSDYRDGFTLNTLEKVLITETSAKYWVYNFKAEKKWNEWKKELIAKNTEEIERFTNAINEARKQYEQEEKRKQTEKAAREQFYHRHLRKIDTHTISYLDKETGELIPRIISHIRNCPEKKKIYSGEYYANVDTHCKNCQYFRGYKNDKQDICCLADYNKNKNRTA